MLAQKCRLHWLHSNVDGGRSRLSRDFISFFISLLPLLFMWFRSFWFRWWWNIANSIEPRASFGSSLVVSIFFKVGPCIFDECQPHILFLEVSSLNKTWRRKPWHFHSWFMCWPSKTVFNDQQFYALTVGYFQDFGVRNRVISFDVQDWMVKTLQGVVGRERKSEYKKVPMSWNCLRWNSASQEVTQTLDFITFNRSTYGMWHSDSNYDTVKARPKCDLH